MSQPEILVHAAAPSHGTDDVRYRQEARAIIQFQAVKRHDILPQSCDHGTGACRARQNSPRQTSQQSVAQPQDSINSTDPAPRHQVTNALSTWMTPPFPHSSPRILVGQTPAPLLLGWAPRLTGHVLVEQTPANQQRPRTAPSGPSIIQETPSLRRSFSDAFETPPSEIPDSQPEPYIHPQHHDDRTCEPSSSPSPTRPEEPAAKKWKGDHQEDGLLGYGTPPDDTSTPPLRTAPLVSSTPPSDKTPTPSPITSTPQHPQAFILAYRRRKVDPPRPETSLRTKVPSHCTSSLKMLGETCVKILEPVRPLRALNRLERGHWRFDFVIDGEEIESKSRWVRRSREDMWSFLVDFIGNGCGGWGLWAIFEEGMRERFDGEDGWIGEREKGEREMGKEDGEAVGRVKVYCYGEVVLEVYALLVLATHRRVKRCGAQWLDSNRRVVVEVKGD